MGSLTGKSSATSLSTAGLSSQLAGDSAVAVNVGYTGGSAQPAWHSFQAQPQTSKWQGDNLFSQSTAAVDKGLNMLVEITLDGRIRYISPTCQRLLGTKPEALINQPASTIFTADSILVCRSAVEQLLADSTRTVEINITVHSPDLSRAAMVEAKGMLIYCRARNEPSHVMWVLRYAVASPPQHQPAPEESVVGSELAERLASALPRPVTEHGEDIAPSALSLGLVGGEDMEFESARELVAVSGGELPDVIEEDEAAAMSLSPVEYITCRICDRAIPATYFEEHNWLCAQSHRAAMDVEQLNERLSDVKAEIQAWYPGCDFEELEDMVHGGTDVETLQEHAQQRASEVGHPAWQDLINEASSSVKSMTKVCLMALALDEYDASPKCTHPAALGALGVQVDSSELDFQRSDNWISVARYTVPVLDYHDPALQSLGESLIRTIAAKLTAIDNLQYAIVESSVACTNWVLPKDSSMVPDAFLSQERLRRSISAIDIPSSNVEQGVSELHYNASTKGIDEARSRSAHTSDPQCTDGIESASQQGLPWQYDQYDGSADASHSRADVGTSPRLGGPAAINMASRRTSSQVNIDIPTIRKTSSASLSVSQMSPLRISTTNLYPTTGTTPNRPNIIGSSAFLATPTVPSIHDFVVLKPISKGAYGSVYLAKKRTTGEYYAIKILKKADMISKNQISNVKAERAIMMAQTGSPFVVRLLYTFQSRTSLYLVMEYLNGGDCAALLKAIGTLSEDWARNYLAEVVLGIEDLHARNVVHRDLKPDNLLIDSEGHLKLTDFGLSKLGFLGRRVDQHALSHPINANDSALLSGTSPGAVTSSSRVWQPYVSGSAESARGVSTDHLSTLDDGSSQPMTPMQAAVVIPSISTPPPMKSDRFNSQHSPQTRPDSVQGKRVSALKGSPTLPNGLGSDGSSNAVAGSSTSLSSSASTSSEAYGNTPAPRHQKHALGTPDYIAPESILGLESGKSVDWWALGIICYEFLFGIPPFHDETPEKVFSNILSADLDFYDELREQLKRENEEKRAQHEQKRALRHQASGSPDEDGDSDDEHEDGDGCDDTGVADISPDARDFITRLLCRDPKKRLGYNGAAEVKAHPIFAGIDWDTLLETQPAFVPQVDDVEDTDYFDT
ncbi:rim15, signal transduction response regulator, partial [Coemansia sp. 'formosensis']